MRRTSFFGTVWSKQPPFLRRVRVLLSQTVQIGGDHNVWKTASGEEPLLPRTRLVSILQVWRSWSSFLKGLYSKTGPAHKNGPAQADACGRLRAGLLRKGRHAPFPVGTGQLLQQLDPAPSRMAVRRRVRGRGQDRDQGFAGGLSENDRRLPRGIGRCNHHKIDLPLRPEYGYPAGNGPRVEGLRRRCFL